MKIKFLLAIAAFASGSLLAQTPTPSPTASATPTPALGTVYQSVSYTYAQRTADAQAVIAANADPVSVDNAQVALSEFLIAQATQATWVSSGAQAAAQAAIQKRGWMTSNVSENRAGILFWTAARQTASYAYPNSSPTQANDRFAFWKGLALSLGAGDAPWAVSSIPNAYSDAMNGLARAYMKVGNYTAALNLANDPYFLNNSNGSMCANALSTIASAKAQMRSSDSLSWAKMAYYTASFSNSQNAITTVSTALRSTDLNIVRANAFIAAQNDATQPNILATVAVPDAYKTGGLPNNFAAVNSLLAGDNKTALQTAMGAYVAATDNNSLNTAVAGVAMILRDIDGNLVRANAFINSQKSGTAFVISELQ